MISSPHISQAALAAGLSARYLFWFGRSGRRYLFTQTTGIGDFAEGVAIVAAGGDIVWTGDVAALTSGARWADQPDSAVYIHLLAATPEERRLVIDDLRPAEGAHLRLAA